MKIIICTFAASIVVLTKATTPPPQQQWSQAAMQQLDQYSDECIKKHPLSEDLLKRGRRREFPDHPDYKKFLFCMMQKTKMMNSDGTPNKEDIKGKLKKVVKDEKRLMKVMKLCLKDMGSPVETAYYVAKCIDREEPNFVPVDV